MATQHIPEQALDLFEKPALGHLATLMPDGSPQVTPIWVDYDGTYILVNTVQGRRKDANMKERPQVAIDIVDPNNPYRFLSVRGKIAEVTEEGADSHIDKLAKRYMGVDKYPWHNPNDKRQIFKILPEHVTGA